jgi:hypothetical protein
VLKQQQVETIEKCAISNKLPTCVNATSFDVQDKIEGQSTGETGKMMLQGVGNKDLKGDEEFVESKLLSEMFEHYCSNDSDEEKEIDLEGVDDLFFDQLDML